ncbi:MAG TPA: ABC transporter permease [Syntrophomonadaceae bacterium]|nr:ABC transporter permease [Syntrophomonadaceae bacterium]
MNRLRLVRRNNESWLVKVAVPIASILLAILVGWIFLAVSGYEAAETYRRMIQGAFGSPYAVSETIVKAIPLALTGLAVSIAFRMKLWNIGAEGQLYMGAFAAGGVVLLLGDWPSLPLLTLMLVAGFAAGAIWGLIPGALRAIWNVNETITTLLLNYVAIFWVSYLVFGPWKDPNAMGFPLAPRFPETAYLPAIPGSRVHVGILIAVAVAIILYMVMRYTRWGFEVRVAGESPEAARYAGMNVARNILLVMLVSGGIAGMTGMIEVSGITHRLQQDISANYGYTGIIIAWLARLNPFAILLVAFLFGALLVGGFGVQTFGIPYAIVLMLQGAVLFFLLAGEIMLKYRVTMSRED